VLLVGAGPGDADLITLRGAEALRRADAVIYDSLVSRQLLDLAPPKALRIDVGKRGHEPPTRSQEEINALLVRLAREGKTVVRQEASACVAAAVPFEVVPGITAALAGPAFAGIPITDRRHSASVAIVTGHRDASRPWTSIRWNHLATAADTLVILMGMYNLEKIVATLIAHGRSPDTPAAIVMNAATPTQQVLVAPLGDLPQRAREEKLGAPAVVLVGEVVQLRNELAWHESQPLAGWRVLVTRPLEQAQTLVDALRESGAQPVAIPTIRTVPLPEDESLRVALERLDAYDALVFTSSNGVRCFAERARSRAIELDRLPMPVFCVGGATAEAARGAGLPEARIPEVPSDAQALLETLATALPPAGRRFLVPTAERAHDTLPRGLRAAGARVDVVAVYRTLPADLEADRLRGLLVRGELDALTFTSPSAARAFVAVLDAPARVAAERSVIAAIGKLTAEELRRERLEPSVVAASPGARALVAALAEYATRRSQGEGA
jgi:uroporphyrinogen III methyltransferase/synthase